MNDFIKKLMAETQSDENSCARDDGMPTNDEFRAALTDPHDPLFARRSFLKTAGFTFAVGALSGCGSAPEKFAMPFVDQPPELKPGRPDWYASLCGGCSAGCGVHMKTRDGRPIKLEGNPDHPVTKGGLCAVGQASLLGLYNSKRLKQPAMNSLQRTWTEINNTVRAKLNSIRERNGKVRILTGTITSPTTEKIISKFVAGFQDAKHISYDPLSTSAILDAHLATHGARILPKYAFDKADVILGIDADFLGSWISPCEYTSGYSAGRAITKEDHRFSYHTQIESRMTLAGSKADERIRVAPHEILPFVADLALVLESKDSASSVLPSVVKTLAKKNPLQAKTIVDLANRLWKAKGKSLIVCGTNDLSIQVLINFSNHLLQSYGKTLNIEEPSFQKKGNDHDLHSLILELKSGQVDALIIHGVNPVFDLPEGSEIAEAIKNMNANGNDTLTLSISDQLDESSSAVQISLPENHFLESWNDAEATSGVITLGQPSIRPLFNTRSFNQILSSWTDGSLTDHEIIKDHWAKNIHPRSSFLLFSKFWRDSVHNGFATVRPRSINVSSFRMESLSNVSTTNLVSNISDVALTLVAYSSVGLREGQHAHNPWLQEMPDPISKIVWDNYASFSPATAKSLDLKNGDVVKLQADNKDVIELPAHIQPGQHDKVVAIALGYGRKGTGRFNDVGPAWVFQKPTVKKGGLVGVNVTPLLATNSGSRSNNSIVTIKKTGAIHKLAATQTHNMLSVPEGLGSPGAVVRPIVQETTVLDYLSGKDVQHKGHVAYTMWGPDHNYPGHHWGMVINLTACTGCTSCVIGCQAENNIPVVGKDEVSRSREMHWLRLDRYYSQESGETDVVQQPMTCHHCDQAPCETVCPVLATVHSTEGLNQQVYNRCVGTRYCANNCPYKVRRFNWFNYAHDDKLQNMVLNPDITIRTRGVMEKCSMCVQRIQWAKTEAKIKGVELEDGDIQPACQQSCSANAIVFGDMNDPKSAVSKAMQDSRYYHVLDELNLKPSIGYLKVVRNRETPGNGSADHEEEKNHG